jgi:phosphate uptake regulator
MKTVKLYEEFINEEDTRDTLTELREMSLGQLERIADYANMIKDRMNKGETLESWMFSQLTISLENLNAIHDAMDGNDKNPNDN